MILRAKVEISYISIEKLNLKQKKKRININYNYRQSLNCLLPCLISIYFAVSNLIQACIQRSRLAHAEQGLEQAFALARILLLTILCHVPFRICRQGN